MKKAIILHGRPSKNEYYDRNANSPSNAHWLPWIQEELIMKDILAQTPELPKAYEPHYENWLKVFNQLEPNEETILIGHSTGAGFLVRWLTKNETKVGKVILVAPYLDPDNTIKNDFFKFKIDPDLVSHTNGVVIFCSDNDDKDIQISVKRLKKEIKHIQCREFHNYGHFTLRSMGTREFPELLKEALK